MLGAELRYFYTFIDKCHYFITNTINFIAEDKRIFYICLWQISIEHDTARCLFDGDYAVPLITKLLYGTNGIRIMHPIYRLCGAKRCLFYFTMWRLCSYTA